MLKKYEIESLQKYFDTANYISACQLYLLDNPLLKRKLEMSDIKKKLVGHWGTVPSQNFIYTNLNYIIKKHNLDMIYISGPGHGGNAMVANTYIEGTYSKVYPNITEDEEGLKKLFKQFSFPGGIPSHAAPETPGSINEGGELGYSVAHAYGAILDNPNLIASYSSNDIVHLNIGILFCAKLVICIFICSISFIFSMSGNSVIFPNNPCSTFSFFIAYSLYPKYFA